MSKEYTPDELYQITTTLQKRGGSFHQALGLALQRADLGNQALLINAFKHDFDRYLEYSKKWG